MKQERREVIIRNIFIVLLCAALPTWIAHLLGKDLGGVFGELCSIILVVVLWLYSQHSKTKVVRIFTAGMLLGEGLLPIFFFLFFQLPQWVVPILVDPGFNFFLWLERGFSSDAVTYTTWYTVVRSFFIPTLNGLVYGVLVTFFLLLLKWIAIKKPVTKN